MTNVQILISLIVILLSPLPHYTMSFDLYEKCVDVGSIYTFLYLGNVICKIMDERFGHLNFSNLQCWLEKKLCCCSLISKLKGLIKCKASLLGAFKANLKYLLLLNFLWRKHALFLLNLWIFSLNWHSSTNREIILSLFNWFLLLNPWLRNMCIPFVESMT